MRGGAHPKVGNRSEVLAAPDTGAAQAVMRGSAAAMVRAAANGVDVRAIAGSLAGTAPCGNGGRSRAWAQTRPVSTGTP